MSSLRYSSYFTSHTERRCELFWLPKGKKNIQNTWRVISACISHWKKFSHLFLQTCKDMNESNSTWLGLIPGYSHLCFPIIQHHGGKRQPQCKKNKPAPFFWKCIFYFSSCCSSPLQPLFLVSLSALSLNPSVCPGNFTAADYNYRHWHHNDITAAPLKSVKHPGLELPPRPPPCGSDAEAVKHNVGRAGREELTRRKGGGRRGG